jgi:hypothetical protein
MALPYSKYTEKYQCYKKNNFKTQHEDNLFYVYVASLSAYNCEIWDERSWEHNKIEQIPSWNSQNYNRITQML